MAHVYTKVNELEKTPKVGDGNSVALVQHFTRVGLTAHWRPGERVMDAAHIPEGTVIATFIDGRYPNNSHGNHAALFVRFGPRSQKTGKPSYIVVMDQWLAKKDVHARSIYPQGMKTRAQGNQYDDSDNADMMFVVK